MRKIRNEMAKEGLEAILISSNANIFYAAGGYFRGYVWIPLDGETIYFVVQPSGWFEPEKDVTEIRKPEQIPGKLAEMGQAIPKHVGLEYATLNVSEFRRLEKVFAESQLKDCTMAITLARMVKTPYEIELMKEDGARQCAAYRRIPGLYRRDMTDMEFQIEIERVLRLEGNLGYLRVAGNLMEINMGSLLAGDNADVPSPYDFAMGGAGVCPALPGGADGEVMHPGVTVMVDMSGCFNGYQTDMTRVWCIGDIPDLARKAHDCSRRILRRLERTALPGSKIEELYQTALSIVEEEGLGKYFMGHRRQAKFIGHGVGIQLNEYPPLTPKNALPLKENMTLAIEPKFVIPGVGAVGVENTYVVTPSGLECITPMPEEIGQLI